MAEKYTRGKDSNPVSPAQNLTGRTILACGFFPIQPSLGHKIIHAERLYIFLPHISVFLV